MSVAVHPVVGVIYEQTRTPRPPRLVVEVLREGKGSGLIQGSIEGLRCRGTKDDSDRCIVEVERGAKVTLTATPGEKSTFMGWTGPCGPQAHSWFAWAFEQIYRGEVPTDPAQRKLYEELLIASTPPENKFPLQCGLDLSHTTKVIAQFGEQPDEVAVEWIQLPDDPKDQPEVAITLPDPSLEAMNVPAVPPPARAPPAPKPPDVIPQQPPEIAQIEPPPPTPVTPTPVPPPQPPPEQKKKEEVEKSRMKAVEVPDKNEVQKAPDDAKFLSDKNRDVQDETHAKETNLEKQQDGKVAASEKSKVKSEDVGGEDDEIKQLETTESTSLEAERAEESEKSGKEKVAKGILKGKEGEDGNEGEDGDGSKATKPGMLSMRGIEGRGAPGGPLVEREVKGDGGSGRDGDGGKLGKSGKKGRRGIKTELEFDDYERIVGHDVMKKEQSQLARRTKSLRRGRWEQKLAAIKSSLENFTPEVKPGNQTALKTRAAPFAVYIARMHRRIHELWGFGFLEDLDDKPASNEMNDWTLWTKIEIVVNQDGTIDKVNIARPSGVLAFDVAALDTVLSAGPFESPPDAIRSADGKTYLHWAFHRDWRQCGTFGAEPYILTTPPRGGQRDKGMSDGEMLGRARRGGKDRGKPAGGGDHAGHDHAGEPAGDETAENAARARAGAAVASPDDPRVKHVANLWLSGFAHNDLTKMIKVSGVPFHAGGGLVAQSGSEIGSVYRNILKETRGRGIQEWRVLSAAGYRKAVGSLPDGANPGPGDLFLVVRLKGEQFTVLLREHTASGEYRAVGFYR